MSAEGILEDNLSSAEREHQLREEVNEKLGDLINFCLSDLKMTNQEAMNALEGMIGETIKLRRMSLEAQSQRP